MSKYQVMIDTLEAQKDEIEAVISQDNAELQALLTKGKAMSAAIEAKREKFNHISHAISNLKAIDEADEELPMMGQDSSDPWGDAS